MVLGITDMDRDTRLMDMHHLPRVPIFPMEVTQVMEITLRISSSSSNSSRDAGGIFTSHFFSYCADVLLPLPFDYGVRFIG